MRAYLTGSFGETGRSKTRCQTADDAEDKVDTPTRVSQSTCVPRVLLTSRVLASSEDAEGRQVR